MNLASFKLTNFTGGQPTWRSAFTLVEVLVAMSIMLMVLAGVLAVQAFGMRLFQLTKAKLGASDDARKAIDLLSNDIRAAKMVKIGNGDFGSTNFTECAPGQLQVGNAIQVYATTNTSSFVRYYRNAGTNQLQRAVNGTDSLTVVANFVTNSAIFACEDALGNTLTDNQNNRVISLTLQIYQIQYPAVQIGAGNYFDFYQLSTKITPRSF